MENKYTYMDQDITIDVIMKIEHVVRLIAEKEKLDFDDCFPLFLGSKTYEALQKTDSLMWAESAEFIVDEYYRG